MIGRVVQVHEMNSEYLIMMTLPGYVRRLLRKLRDTQVCMSTTLRDVICESEIKSYADVSDVNIHPV